MASRLVPKYPEKVMVIRTLPDTNIVTCSTPFLRFGYIQVGGRATLVPMENNELAVFAPVALTRNVRDLIDKDMDAKVKYIIAPDAEHHIFLSDWQKEYPEAKVIVPEPLVEKRRKAGQLLPEQGDPRLVAIKEGASYSVDPTFDQQFNLEYVHAHANKELVFNHKASRTLIEADLMFNLPAREQTSMLGRSQPSGILSRIFGGMNSTQGEALSQRRFIWYLISAGNRSAFNSSVSRIDGWDFDRIVPCHGDVIETGGKGIFQKVFQWHLQAHAKSN